jgi:hypothetical protein
MSSSLSLVSNEVTVKAKKPRKTTKPTASPIVEEAFTVPKTNYSPTVEGFQATQRNRTFPVYVGPSIYFKRSMMDIFYNQYDNDNLKPNPDMVSLLNNMQVEDPDLPNYGAMLATFDSSAINSIPWDADNSTSLQSDIVWGQVTEDASKSIFMKSYHAALLSDPSNIDTTGQAPLYQSVMFPISADNPGAAMFLQISDAVAGVAGQMAVTHMSEKIEKLWKNAMSKQLLDRLEKAKVARMKYLADVKANSTLYSRVADYTNSLRGITNDPVLDSINREIDSVNNAKNSFNAAEAKAIADKEAAKTALSNDEKLIKAANALNDAKAGKPIAASTTKVSTKVGVAARLKMGARAATALGKKLAGSIQTVLRKMITTFTQTLAIATAKMYGVLAIMNFSFSAASVASGGVLAPMLAVVIAMTTAYGIFDAVCQVLTILLMIILPALLDKALENGGVCPSGSLPIDQIITDESLYYLFSTFCPIGGLMDVFGPYICYKSDGTPVMKRPLYIPAYYSDSSLSISKHNWPANEIPRPEATSYETIVPTGWRVVAGIAREPCVEGTWTSSDVDMLCNISTYVPRTYAIQSRVPRTVVKGSSIPTTHVKQTFITTRIKDTPRQVRVPTYRPCPSGMRDSAVIPGTIGDCWDDLKCKTQCWGDWNPSHWGCRTGCTGTGGIAAGHHFYDREECPAGFDKYLSLCRSKCDASQGFNATVATDLFCTGTCAADETTWGVFCTGNTDAYCNSHAAEQKDSRGNNRGFTAGNWKNVAGVCWQGCNPATQHNIGALCRDKCPPDKKETAGVCWDNCAPDTEEIGALCRDRCGGSTPHDVAGICWGDCGNDNPQGALCREYCRPGFHEVAGVCWGNVGTYARNSMIPKSIKKYDPGYNPVNTKEELTFPWCDFGREDMLDRMAQFYYDQSTLNPQQLDDGRISYEYIVQFYGVIASSELSCDVACQMKTVVFDPVTGGRYEESLGTTYPDDPGNQVSYRRFYFIHISAATAAILAARAAADPSLKVWPADTNGLFTITGCTNSDYTAPDAMHYSTDYGVDPIMSLPKIYRVRDKRNSNIIFDETSFYTSAATTASTLLIGAVPPIKRGKSGGVRFNLGRKEGSEIQPSMAQQVGGAVAGGLIGEALTNAINKAMNAKVPVGVEVQNAVVGPLTNSANPSAPPIFSVITENDNFTVDHGPIYECRARDNNGYFPTINFCGKVNTTDLLCSHPLILRDTIDLYHSQNPTLHIKTVNAIEPRGKDGCYYKFNTTSYNADNNSEGNFTTVQEVVLKYEQNDTSTCVFTPTTIFTTDMSKYPVRSYYDVNTKSTAYPTRKVTSTATVQGRYVRIRPSPNGDGFIRLSQIAVYDMTDTNLALSRPVYTNATASEPSGSGSGSGSVSGTPNTIVDGTLACRSSGPGVWVGGSNKETTYIDIDLGQNYLISYVMFFGQLDVAAPANDIGTRIEILYTNGPTDVPQKQLDTKTSSRIEKVDFSTQMILPKLPVKPFQVPRPLPPEVNLGTGCATRCEDKNQIDAIIQKYNTTNTTSQILKITKAFTPKDNRCDYEAEIVSNDGMTKTVSKQNISFTAGSKVANVGGVIYGKYVRINAIPSPESSTAALPDPLKISQIVITNAAGKNVALGKKTFATINDVRSMNPAAYGVSSLVTDGTASERPAPKFWSSGIYSDMSIMVDLGISHDIASISIYGVAGTNYAGAVVQVLTSANVDATPVYSIPLPAGQTSFLLNNFPACNFTYTLQTPAFSYIQDTTPFLDSVDTSGGVLSFKGISDSIVGIFNSIINPIKTANPLGVLNTNIDAANKAVSNIAVVAAANLQITGCPNTKCTDPAILTSIANAYNTKNSIANTQYGAETNTMSQVIKAGVSGPRTCDVMFTNLYKLYDDFLYPPTLSENQTVVKRFTMTDTGNCALRVTAGSTIVDLSSNAVGIIPPSSALSSPFNITACQVNCRDPAIIASLKTKLNSTTSQGINNFTSIMQSFANGASTCEYYMTKDVSKQNSVTKKISTKTGLYTYVTANMTVNPSNCSFTVDSAVEVDPDLIETTQDPITGLTTATLNRVAITLPYLFNYDNSTPSTRVNETPLNI